jgi:hypothetical protein
MMRRFLRLALIAVVAFLSFDSLVGQTEKVVPEVEGVLNCTGLHTGKGNAITPKTCDASGVDQDLVEAGLGDTIALQIKGLKAWINDESKPDPWKLIPYIDGRPLARIFPSAVDPEQNKLTFDLRLSPESKDTWIALLSSHTRHKVSVSVGPENKSPFPTQAAFELRIFQWPWVISFIIFLIFALGGFIYLAARSGVLREPGPAPSSGKPKAFSLARFQIAVWFFVILVCYIFILVITWDRNILSDSVLGLMGISAGTYLGAIVVDSSKRTDAQDQLPQLKAQLAQLKAMAAPTPDGQAQIDALNQKIRELSASVDPDETHGLLVDILSDANGVSFHRFQMVAWTGVVVILFIKSVWTALVLPDLNGTLLGLMGISSGTYLGAKFPEQKK